MGGKEGGREGKEGGRDGKEGERDMQRGRGGKEGGREGGVWTITHSHAQNVLMICLCALTVELMTRSLPVSLLSNVEYTSTCTQVHVHVPDLYQS